jgi:putative DeoR family transcriptional regulator (stage III sporulation protein D)
LDLKGLPEERAVALAQYIVEKGATVRQAAKKFSVSKSTVHKDVSERLRTVNENLYEAVKRVLEQNKQERHIRGGLATKTKYELLRGK